MLGGLPGKGRRAGGQKGYKTTVEKCGLPEKGASPNAMGDGEGKNIT